MAAEVKVAGFSHDKDSIEKDLKEALDAVGWHERIRSDSKVFVKPNLTLPYFKAGVTTHGHVTEALLGILKDRASEVYVGESDGGYESFTADYSLRNHDIPGICERTGAEMLDLSKQERVVLQGVVNGKKISVKLPRPLLGMDETVSVPVLKTHVVVGVTLSLKNMWGCNPDTLRILDHTRLSERLALIARVLRLGLVVVDGIYGMDRRGPIEGDAVDVGVILAGNNPVATDAVATRLMGLDAGKIGHIRVASAEGLGPHRSGEIEVLGDLSRFQQHFCVRPTLVDSLSALTFRSGLLTKMVFDSPFTPPIYAVLGRTSRKKIVAPGGV